MNIFIEAIDRRGYKIICTKEIWFNKILVSRPWMKGWEGLVKEAIQNHSFICEDTQHHDRIVYYWLHRTRLHNYIRVVARINAKNEGFVISAFPSDSGKQKENVIWLPSKA